MYEAASLKHTQRTRLYMPSVSTGPKRLHHRRRTPPRVVPEISPLMLRPGESLSKLYVDVFGGEDVPVPFDREQHQRLCHFLDGRLSKDSMCTVEGPSWDGYPQTRLLDGNSKSREKRRRGRLHSASALDRLDKRLPNAVYKRKMPISESLLRAEFYAYVNDARRREQDDAVPADIVAPHLSMDPLEEENGFLATDLALQHIQNATRANSERHPFPPDPSDEDARRCAAFAVLQQRLQQALRVNPGPRLLTLPFFFKGLSAQPLMETYPSALQSISPFLALVSSDGLTFSYNKTGSSQTGFGTVLTDRCIPWSPVAYYFEARIQSTRGDGGRPTRRAPMVTVGVAFPRSECEETVDGDFNYMGYRSEDGYHVGTDIPQPFGEPFTWGDVVGCCIHFPRRCLTFTKNGSVVGTTLQLPRDPPISPTRRPLAHDPVRFFPMVSIASPSDQVSVNLGCSTCACLTNGALGIQLVSPNRQQEMESILSAHHGDTLNNVPVDLLKRSSCVCLCFGLTPAWAQPARQFLPPPPFVYNYEERVVQGYLREQRDVVLRTSVTGTLSHESAAAASASKTVSERAHLSLSRVPTPPPRHRSSPTGGGEEITQHLEPLSQEGVIASSDNVGPSAPSSGLDAPRDAVASVLQNTFLTQTTTPRPLLISSRPTQRAQRDGQRRPPRISADALVPEDQRRVLIHHPITPPSAPLVSLRQTGEPSQHDVRISPPGRFTVASSSSSASRMRRDESLDTNDKTARNGQVPPLILASSVGSLAAGTPLHHTSINYVSTGLANVEDIIRSFLLHAGYLDTLSVFSNETEMRTRTKRPGVYRSAFDHTFSAHTPQSGLNPGNLSSGVETTGIMPQVPFIAQSWKSLDTSACEDRKDATTSKTSSIPWRCGNQQTAVALSFSDTSCQTSGIQRLLHGIHLSEVRVILEDLCRDRSYWKKQAASTKGSDACAAEEMANNNILSSPYLNGREDAQKTLDAIINPVGDMIFRTIIQWMANSPHLSLTNQESPTDVTKLSCSDLGSQCTPGQEALQLPLSRNWSQSSRGTWVHEEGGHLCRWENDRSLLYGRLRDLQIECSGGTGRDESTSPSRTTDSSFSYLIWTIGRTYPQRCWDLGRTSSNCCVDHCGSASSSSVSSDEDGMLSSRATPLAPTHRSETRQRLRRATQHRSASLLLPTRLLPRLTLSGLALIEQAYFYYRQQRFKTENERNSSFLETLFTQGKITVNSEDDDDSSREHQQICAGLTIRTSCTLHWIASLRQELRELIMSGYSLMAIELFRIFLPTSFLETPLSLALVFLLTHYLVEITSTSVNNGGSKNKGACRLTKLKGLAQQFHRNRTLWILNVAPSMLQPSVDRAQFLPEYEALSGLGKLQTEDLSPSRSYSQHPLQQDTVTAAKTDCVDPSFIGKQQSGETSIDVLSEKQRDIVALWWMRYVLWPLYPQLDRSARAVLLDSCQVLHHVDDTCCIMARRTYVADLIDAYLLDRHFGIGADSPLAVLVKQLIVSRATLKRQSGQLGPPVTVRSLSLFGKGLPLSDVLLSPLRSFDSTNAPVLAKTIFRCSGRPGMTIPPILYDHRFSKDYLYPRA